MAEKDQNSQIANQRTEVRAEATAFLATALLVAGLPVLLLIACVALLIAGQNSAALVTGVATAVTGGPQIIAAVRSGRSKEKP